MENQDLISIIVPVYKVEPYLDCCVQSIVDQTYRNLEIILVDDGSPDNCGAMCDAWAERDSRIRVIHKENAGVSAARNTGIDAATGKWILFVDSDDAASVHMVKALADAGAGTGRLAVSGMDRFSDTVPKEDPPGYAAKNCGKNLSAVRGGLYCWGALYSRELVTALDLRFDPTLRNVEDVVWNGIYLRYISEVVSVNVPYYYRMTPDSITSKCNDYRWQVASWIGARRSLMNWFTGKTLTKEQKKETAQMFRHCQNNIYAECVAGGVCCRELNEMERKATAAFDETPVFAPERIVRRNLPQVYYWLYTTLLKAKCFLTHRK